MRLVVLLLVTTCALGRAQVINRAPHFIHHGDMARLAVPESTPPGSAVYTLRGEDPEGSKLHYSISGEYFTVNRETGLVVLRKALDRESQDLIEVIISITGNYHFCHIELDQCSLIYLLFYFFLSIILSTFYLPILKLIFNEFFHILLSLLFYLFIFIINVFICDPNALLCVQTRV